MCKHFSRCFQPYTTYFFLQNFVDIFSVGVWRPESGFHCGMFCCEFLYFWHYKDYKDKMAAIRRLGWAVTTRLLARRGQLLWDLYILFASLKVTFWFQVKLHRWNMFQMSTVNRSTSAPENNKSQWKLRMHFSDVLMLSYQITFPSLFHSSRQCSLSPPSYLTNIQIKDR